MPGAGRLPAGSRGSRHVDQAGDALAAICDVVSTWWPRIMPWDRPQAARPTAPTTPAASYPRGGSAGPAWPGFSASAVTSRTNPTRKCTAPGPVHPSPAAAAPVPPRSAGW